MEVTNQVVSFLRRRVITGEVLGEEPLDLPPRHLRTRAVWWTVDEAGLERAGLTAADVPGAAHAAEHASIGLLPLFATCDRWDIGGVSTAHHADTGRMTVFVYDGHPGGAGFAERGHARRRRLAHARPATRSPPASASTAARRACSRPSAATATTRWTRPAPCGCSTVVLGDGAAQPGCMNRGSPGQGVGSERGSPCWHSAFCS